MLACDFSLLYFNFIYYLERKKWDACHDVHALKETHVVAYIITNQIKLKRFVGSFNCMLYDL